MKIGLIVPGFSSDERDWCIPALLDLARSLAVSNEMQVFALRYPHRADVYRIGDVVVRSFGGRVRRGAASGQLWVTVLAALAQEHRKRRFDILHAVYGGEAGWVTVAAAKLLRIPCIVSLVGGELIGLPEIAYGADLQPRQRLMNNAALRYADSILCGSKMLAVHARARIAPARQRIVQTLPLGVDTQLFATAGKSGKDRGVNILNVGSLIPVKHQETLLRATAEFMQSVPNARLTIIGSGPLENALRECASSLRIAERVQFAGAIAHDQLPEEYRRADLFVQSSLHEGEGMAVLEAAACGTALTGTAVGVLADLAERGAAIAVPPNDPLALAGAMQRAFAAGAVLGTRAGEIAQQDYSLTQIREKLIDHYCSLQPQKAANVVQNLSKS